MCIAVVLALGLGLVVVLGLVVGLGLGFGWACLRDLLYVCLVWVCGAGWVVGLQFIVSLLLDLFCLCWVPVVLGVCD